MHSDFGEFEINLWQHLVDSLNKVLKKYTYSDHQIFSRSQLQYIVLGMLFKGMIMRCNHWVSLIYYTNDSRFWGKYITLDRGLLNIWLDRGLLNRQQRVTLKGFTSAFQMLNAGVPQGSILGPFLFLYRNH